MGKKVMRSYEISVRKVGEILPSEYHSAYAPDGELPEEWEAIQERPDVDHAEIYTASQRRFRADKRNLSGRYEREA